MATINPYLNFPGTAEEAFTFYKSIFGGEFSFIQRFKDSPESGTIGEFGDKIMHISLPIGKGNVLMATDALESQGFKLVQGNNFHLTVSTETKEEADRIFNALAAGGKITMPIADMFWGAYFGMITDKFGINWMVSYDKNYQS
jgi:PhnB protein